MSEERHQKPWTLSDVVEFYGYKQEPMHKEICPCYPTEDGCVCGGCEGNKFCSDACIECEPPINQDRKEREEDE